MQNSLRKDFLQCGQSTREETRVYDDHAIGSIMDWSGAISDEEFAIMLRELFSEQYGGQQSN